MWFLPESHLPGPEKTYGGKLVWRMSDGRRNNWKNIIWRSAIVSEIFFGQSVVIMIRNYSKQTVLYEAVKQGAFARYFDQKKLGMYLMKKLHFSAGEDMLLPLQRFRNYEEPRETNERIFQFRAYANNRDGLALKTVCSSLMERPEKNKILIVLSDGKPCDMSIQRPGTRQPKIYDGEKAVKDTAYEVRRARNQGIFVIGIFVGNEEELSVEKRIYGKDFAYIRNISNFSRIVGTFLRRQIDME